MAASNNNNNNNNNNNIYVWTDKRSNTESNSCRLLSIAKLYVAMVITCYVSGSSSNLFFFYVLLQQCYGRCLCRHLTTKLAQVICSNHLMETHLICMSFYFIYLFIYIFGEPSKDSLHTETETRPLRYTGMIHQTHQCVAATCQHNS